MGALADGEVQNCQFLSRIIILVTQLQTLGRSLVNDYHCILMQLQDRCRAGS